MPDPAFLALPFDQRLAKQPPLKVCRTITRVTIQHFIVTFTPYVRRAHRAQVKVTVPDDDAASTRGYAATKELDFELQYEGIKQGKMLYSKMVLEGNAAHIELFDAYGIKPRSYDFPDLLLHLATMPFLEVTIGKKMRVYCAVYHNTRTGTSGAVLYAPELGATIEHDLQTLPKGTASKDEKYRTAAMKAFEVRDSAHDTARYRACDRAVD